MWYLSRGGQSQSDTSQLTASVKGKVGCITCRFLMTEDIYAASLDEGLAQKRVDLSPLQPHKILCACRHGTAAWSPIRSSHPFFVSPLLQPSVAACKCRVPRIVPAASQFHFLTAWLDKPGTSQVSSTSPGRPKNISHVPIKHVF